jgi:hypothetical protein
VETGFAKTIMLQQRAQSAMSIPLKAIALRRLARCRETGAPRTPHLDLLEQQAESQRSWINRLPDRHGHRGVTMQTQRKGAAARIDVQ